jgi:hypothetical protein
VLTHAELARVRKISRSGLQFWVLVFYGLRDSIDKQIRVRKQIRVLVSRSKSRIN